MRPSNRVITLGLALFAVTGCQRDELAPYAFPQPVTVECESPPSGYLNVNYSWTPEHEFGVDPLMWSAVNLPPGLTMDPATGEISGVPTEVGIFEIEITVRDSNEPAQVSVVSCGSIEILPGGVICGDPFLPNAIVGEPYSHQLKVSAAVGNPPFVWTAVDPLPPGLTLDANTGIISGTPTMEGMFPLNVIATDSDGVEYPQDCGTLDVFPRLEVDGDKLLEVYPDGCVGPGVTLQDLVDNGVLVGGTDDPITCEYRGGLGNGNFPTGVSIDANNCSIQGTVAPSEEYGLHLWITSFIQGPVTAHVPYCAPQMSQPGGAYSVTQTFMGSDATFKPGTTQRTNATTASWGSAGDPNIDVEQVCNAPACFYKFYFSYNTLSGAASVSANPNGKLGMGMAFDGFFHSLSFTDSGVSANITDRHWVVNFDFVYCISDVEADCDSKDKAVMNGSGSNYTIGVVVRP